jgi:hypothetical protein
VSLAVAFVMPFVMLAFVFLLARIEDKHLVNRSRVLMPAAPAPSESTSKQEAA